MPGQLRDAKTPGLDAAANAAVGKMIAKPPSAKKAMLLIAAGVIILVVVTTGWAIFKKKLGLATPKGYLAYTALGIDLTHADPDRVIAVLDGPAHQWARDAVWWGATFTHVHADGTVDLSTSATVTYISPSRVQDLVPSRRKDSIKDFSFSAAGVQYSAIKGANPRWQDVHPPQHPTCTIKQVVALLKSNYGFVDGKEVRITFDPKVSGLLGPVDGWHVVSEDPKLGVTFSFADCAVLKP